MKKQVLLLVSSAALAAGAAAQSNVMIYGVADVGVNYTDFKRGAAGNTLSLDSGGSQGSRFGLRGSEDLGGGLSAQFTLEGGYTIDNGNLAFNGRLFGRQAWIALDSKTMGTLAMGRAGSFSSGAAAYDMWVSIDPFKTAFGLASLNNTFSSGALRLDNTVFYRSPKMGGFQGGLLYSFQSAQAILTENPGSGNNNRTIGAGLSYANGPLYAVMTYDLIKPATITSGALAGRTNPDQKHFQLGATYDFGVAKVHGAYAKQTDHSLYSPVAADLSFASTVDPLSRPDADSYMLGLTVPVGVGSILASYQLRDGEAVRTSAAATYEADRRVFAIGYVHPLSKRTRLYVEAADSTGKKSIAEGSAANDAFNRREFRVGVNHNF
ncbi:MAG TPA: porin [Noviherbaspirillum sp.]|nr:porin [Noviherbaspirillum sp.]